MTIHDQPWLFGDEYLYLNKARNLSHNIGVITDATQRFYLNEFSYSYFFKSVIES